MNHAEALYNQTKTKTDNIFAGMMAEANKIRNEASYSDNCSSTLPMLIGRKTTSDHGRCM